MTREKHKSELLNLTKANFAISSKPLLARTLKRARSVCAQGVVITVVSAIRRIALVNICSRDTVA